MKASGIIIRLKEEEHFGMLKEMSMMENSKMIRLTAMEFTPMLMDRAMKVIGKMICRKVMVVKCGQTAQNILAIIRKEKSIIMEFMSGPTNQSMKEIGMKIE
jgi:hypothetical protein